MKVDLKEIQDSFIEELMKIDELVRRIANIRSKSKITKTIIRKYNDNKKRSSNR